MSPTALEFKRGWRSLLAAAIGNGSGLSGLSFYTFGVFVLPLSAAFGWTRGEVSTAASFLIIGTAITAPLIGSVIDRYGARRVGITSMIALAFVYAALTQLEGTLGVFYAAWLALSLIGGGTTPVVWTRTVNIWFDRGRGLALGVALAGSGVAGIFAPVLISRVIADYGWQAGYLALGGFILIVSVPAIAVLLQERPTAAVTASQSDKAEEPAAPMPGLVLAEALREVAFWKIAVGFFFVSAVIAALIIIGTGWERADALASAVVALMMLPRTWSLLREAVDVLLEAAPRILARVSGVQTAEFFTAEHARQGVRIECNATVRALEVPAGPAAADD
jgi:MFS family permease